MADAPLTFTTTVELGGKTATGFEVPATVVEALGAGKRPPVTVSVAGHTYRTTVASMGGRFLIPLSAEHREAAALTAGDDVEVSLALDTEPRTVEVPADLAAALDAAPAARRTFDGLSYSRQRAHVLSVEGAKTDATRQRRIAKVLAELDA